MSFVGGGGGCVASLLPATKENGQDQKGALNVHKSIFNPLQADRHISLDSKTTEPRRFS